MLKDAKMLPGAEGNFRICGFVTTLFTQTQSFNL